MTRKAERSSNRCPFGAHDGLTAPTAAWSDFERVYLSRSLTSASLGLPDLGIVTIEETCVFLRQIAQIFPMDGRRRRWCAG